VLIDEWQIVPEVLHHLRDQNGAREAI